MRTHSVVFASFNKARWRQQGLFLMEVMVTLFTIMLAVLALGRLQAEILTGSAIARHGELALNLALDRLEDMRFVLTGDPGVSSRPRSGEERVGPPGSGAAHERPGLERIYDVRWQASFLGPWRDGLWVEVRWNEPGSGEHSIEIETRLCRIPRYVPLQPGGGASLGRLYRANTAR